MSTLKNNLYIKIAVIIFLSIVLLIPAALIKGLIEERESTQTEAFSEISSKWGGAQT
ncbi:MAG: cell envelope integrity protein CreD, partial [Bacteroidetes bacterium]